MAVRPFRRYNSLYWPDGRPRRSKGDWLSADGNWNFQLVRRGCWRILVNASNGPNCEFQPRLRAGSIFLGECGIAGTYFPTRAAAADALELVLSETHLPEELT